MSERRFRQMMEKVTNFAIVFQDANGFIEEWNVGAENIFGWRHSEIIGQSVDKLFTPADREKAESKREMERAAKDGKAEDERWHLRRDGTLFYASGLMHAIFEEGVLSGFVKIVRDLTERVALQAALQDAKNLLHANVREGKSEVDQYYKVLTLQSDERERDIILHSALVRRVLITQEDERKRIARDLHDHCGQKLTALRLMIENLKGGLENDGNLRNRIEKLEVLAGDIDSNLSFMAWELRPAEIDDLGLEETLETFVSEWSEQFETPADMDFDLTEDTRLPSMVEINLYRIAQEALNNAAKYAQASAVKVSLARTDGSVVLTVEDNGVGFDPEERTRDGMGLGLIGMGERASLLQGKLDVRSAKGKGTTVRVAVPAVYKDAITAGL
jgi:PAS domain S-box-containing protein